MKWKLNTYKLFKYPLEHYLLLIVNVANDK